jgi:hypothetical protein
MFMAQTTATGTTLARPAGQVARSRLQSPYAVTALVGLLYLGLLAWLWQHFHGDPLGFVHIGTIWRDHNPAGTWGYDGQFYYYTAVYPSHAADFMDLPAIRLQRIFFPLVIFAGALGQDALVPYVIPVINWLAVVGGTLLVALLLQRWGRSPWFALSYALASGIPVALTFDTAEPLTFALVALAVLFWEYRRPAEAADRSAGPAPRRALLTAGLAFAAALLTRELAAYFVAAYAAASVLRRDWRGFLAAALAFVPVTVWGLYLSASLHTLSVSQVQPFEHIPFITYWIQGNLVDPQWRSAGYAAQYIVPAFVFGVLGLWYFARPFVAWLRTRTWQPPSPLLIAVLGNVHLMTFLPRLGYQHQVAVSRYALGLALAAVLWAGSARPRWLLWLTPLYALSILAYLFGLVTQDPAYLW